MEAVRAQSLTKPSHRWPLLFRDITVPWQTRVLPTMSGSAMDILRRLLGILERRRVVERRRSCTHGVHAIILPRTTRTANTQSLP